MPLKIATPDKIIFGKRYGGDRRCKSLMDFESTINLLG